MGPGAPGMLGQDSLPNPPRGPSGGIRQLLSDHSRAAGRESPNPLPPCVALQGHMASRAKSQVSSSHEGGGLLWARRVFSLPVPLAPPDSRLASSQRHGPVSLQSAAPPPWDCSPLPFLHRGHWFPGTAACGRPPEVSLPLPPAPADFALPSYPRAGFTVGEQASPTQQLPCGREPCSPGQRSWMGRKVTQGLRPLTALVQPDPCPRDPGNRPPWPEAVLGANRRDLGLAPGCGRPRSLPGLGETEAAPCDHVSGRCVPSFSPRVPRSWPGGSDAAWPNCWEVCRLGNTRARPRPTDKDLQGSESRLPGRGEASWRRWAGDVHNGQRRNFQEGHSGV